MNKATVYYTDGKVEELSHKPTLTELQSIVGGWIEIVHRTKFNPTFHGQMIVNSDGHPLNLPVNKKGSEVYGDPTFKIVGNIVILTGSFQLD